MTIITPLKYDMQEYLNRLSVLPNSMKNHPDWLFFRVYPSAHSAKLEKRPFSFILHDNKLKIVDKEYQYNTRSFDESISVYPSIQGKVRDTRTLGFYFKEDKHRVGIDIDDATNPDGSLKPIVKEILSLLPKTAYVEYSISKTGIHIIGAGSLPPKWKAIKHFLQDHSIGIEMYEKGRAFSITGLKVEGFPGSDLFPDLTTFTHSLAAEYVEHSEFSASLDKHLKDSTGKALLPPIASLPNVIKKGSRHQALMAYAGWYSRKGLSDEDVVTMLMKNIVTRFDKTGRMANMDTEALLKECADCVAYAHNKRQEELEDEKRAQLQLLEQVEHKRLVDENDYQYPFTEEDAANAPYPINLFIHAINKRCMYPCSQLAIAYAAILMGTIRLRSFTTSRGGGAVSYFAAIGESSSGKDSPMAIIKNTMSSLRFAHLCFDNIRSDAGLFGSLVHHAGVGVGLLNESADLFRISKDGKTAHMGKLQPTMINLWDKYDDERYSYGESMRELNQSQGKQKAAKSMVLYRPRFNAVAVFQPSTISALLTPESIKSGFYPRFIPVYVPYKVEPSRPSPDNSAFNQEDDPELWEFIQQEMIYAQTDTQTRMLEELDGKQTDGAATDSLSLHIAKFTPEAHNYLDDMIKQDREQAKSQDDDVMKSIALKDVEKIIRLCCAFAPRHERSPIDLNLVEFLAKFVRAGTALSIDLYKTKLGVSSMDKDFNTVHEIIQNIYDDQIGDEERSKGILKMLITKRVGRKLTSQTYNNILRELEECGVVKKVEVGGRGSAQIYFLQIPYRRNGV